VTIGARLNKLEGASSTGADTWAEQRLREKRAASEAFDWDSFKRLMEAHFLLDVRPDAQTPPDEMRRRAAELVRRAHSFYNAGKPLPPAAQLSAEADELAEEAAGLSPAAWREVANVGYGEGRNLSEVTP
jgi:hypothetical protein